MMLFLGQRNGIKVVCALALAATAMAWIFSTTGSKKISAVHAQSKASPKTAPSLCNTTTQPNIGNIANAISNQGTGPFITDLNVLSQAAWCTFLWLNWPTENNPKIGDCLNPAGGQTCQVRWEAWLPSTSVYCQNGAAPNPTTGCSASPKTALRMLRMGTNPGTRGTQSVGPGGIPLGPTQPTGFALPDKNNSAANESIIFYESVEEPSLVQFLIKNKLFNLDGQQALYNSLNLKGAAGTAGLPPPSGLPAGQAATPLDFPPTAFELKPSWYLTSPSEVQSLGMINSKGGAPAGIKLPTSCPTSPCTIGLTGFHIIWKVFPKSPWFWATFEFKGNTTIAPMLKTQQPNANLPSNTNVSKGPYIPYNFQAQTDPMSKAADAATAQFQQLLAKTVLANYRLVGVQVAPTLDATPTGPISYLANNHLETDFGAVKIGNSSGAPQTVNRSSSCITCHYNASIGSTNTTPCKYDSTGKYLSGTAYFRRAPIYLRNQDAANPPFSNNNGLGPCAAYNDANGNPGGYTGPFKPSVYKHQCESKGSFVSGDFVWSLQEASWASATKGCPATRPPAQ
ncbi:MAG: hypothetical protein ABJF23_04240 [Bryobacteraceae bacterium]